MDRYFRSLVVVAELDIEIFVSIHLLWTGTLEAIAQDEDEYRQLMFQSIFYGQVL